MPRSAVWYAKKKRKMAENVTVGKKSNGFTSIKIMEKRKQILVGKK